MKNVKKFIAIFMVCIVTLGFFSGCSTHKEISYTYNVNTGDRVKVTLNAKDGYTMTSSTPIKIKKNDESIAEAKFYQLSAYTSTLNAARSMSNTTVIEESSNDDVDYLFYNYNNEEFSYVIRIKNSKTCIVLTCIKSEDEAKACFKRLKFELDKQN